MIQVVVIGAGILGASTAFHLAREAAAVTVVDAAHAGRATAAGAGIVCPWVSGAEDAAFYALYAAGARYYPQILADLADLGEADTGYSRVGALCVAEGAETLAAIEGLALRRAAAAPEAGAVERLGPAAARALFPPLRPGLGGVFIAGGARVDGRRMTAALLGAATRLGAVQRRGQAELLADGGRAAVRLAGETLAADIVVVAAGAWAAELLQPLGIELGIAPERGQIVHLGLAGADTSRWPVVLPSGSHYLLAFEDSRVVAGATREDVGFDHRVTAAGLAEVLEAALRVAPGLAAASVIETRIGFRPVGPGYRPMLGWAPGVQGLLVGNGLGAAGLTIGPFAGRMLAQMALGRNPDLDAEPFRPAHSLSPGRQPRTVLR